MPKPNDTKPNGKKRPKPPPAPSIRPLRPEPGPIPAPDSPPPPSMPASAPEGELLDLLQMAQEGAVASPALEALRLNEKPVRFSLFTRSCEKALLHYQEHEILRGYHHCLGDGCPPCLIGDKPSEVYLVPVFDFAALSIKLLRVSTVEGPHRLWSLLRPHLADPRLGERVFTVRRAGTRYELTAADLPPHAERGAARARQFELDLQARRVRLRDAFPTPGVEELRAIPEIRNHLAAMGQLEPETPAPTDEAELDVLEAWEGGGEEADGAGEAAEEDADDSAA